MLLKIDNDTVSFGRKKPLYVCPRSIIMALARKFEYLTVPVIMVA